MQMGEKAARLTTGIGFIRIALLREGPAPQFVLTPFTRIFPEVALVEKSIEITVSDTEVMVAPVPV
jgi:hypothetical protein